MSRTPVGKLWVDTVDVKPQEVSWSERLGESLDGWNCWQAEECDECGRTVVLAGLIFEDEHREIDSEGAPECQCHLYNEGPMMNYFYPLPELRGTPEGAALSIKDLPLCVVELEGEYGLALTGGGMDLSWAICEAYMRLGWLPPVHFCQLPRFAGMTLTANNRWILAGCQRSCRILAGWSQRRGKEIARTRKELATR